MCVILPLSSSSEIQHPLPLLSWYQVQAQSWWLFYLWSVRRKNLGHCGQNIKLGVLHCSWLFAMQMGGFVSHSAISMVTKWRQVCITSLVKCNPSPGTCAKEACRVKGTAIYFLEMKAIEATSGFCCLLFFFSQLFQLLLPRLLHPLFLIPSFSRVPIVKN